MNHMNEKDCNKFVEEVLTTGLDLKPYVYGKSLYVDLKPYVYGKSVYVDLKPYACTVSLCMQT